MLTLFYALLTAVLLILIQPAPSLVGLAPIALSPLLYSLVLEKRPKRAFLLGYAAGCLYWFVVCYWIQFVLEVHGGMGFWGGWGTFLLFCLAKGLHLGVFAILAHRLWKGPAPFLTIPALWTALERTHSTFGFMWLHLGNAGIDFGALARLAPITGVYGISFVFAFVSTMAVLIWQKRTWTSAAPLLAVLLTFALPALPPRSEGEERAAVAQPNLDTETEWTRPGVQQFEKELIGLTLRAALQTPGRKPSVLVWPEVPAPVYYDADPEFRAEAETLARTAGAPFLFGTVTHDGVTRILNSAQLLDASGVSVARYDKINLVPFGEFIPPLFGFVNRITNEVGDFTPGEKIVVFPLQSHWGATFICYESAFPHDVRKFVASGAEVLFNLSNDGYFGHSAARVQHLSLVRMRAAENGRWILRSTNDGITASIDSAGRIVSEMPSYQRAAGPLPFSYVTQQTLYTRWGDWFVAVCAVIAIGGLSASMRRV